MEGVRDVLPLVDGLGGGGEGIVGIRVLIREDWPEVDAVVDERHYGGQTATAMEIVLDCIILIAPHDRGGYEEILSAYGEV